MTQKFKLQCCAGMAALYWVLACLFLLKGFIPFWLALVCMSITSGLGIPATLMLLSMRLNKRHVHHQIKVHSMQQTAPYSYRHA